MQPQAYEPRRPPQPPVDPRSRALPRDGSNLLEALLKARMPRLVQRLPAATVVEVLLWPKNRATLAREAGYKSVSVAYNALKPAPTGEGGARRHPQRPFRKRYALALGCPVEALDELVETPAAGEHDEPEPAATGASPSRPPAVRDGSSLLERRAVARVEQQVQHFTASAVVQLLLWPQTLTRWAAEHGFSDSAVFNCLCWTSLLEYRPLRRALSATLAERFGEDAVVAERALDVLIETPAAPWPRAARGGGPRRTNQIDLPLPLPAEGREPSPGGGGAARTPE